jgi:hypothetical protein
MVTVGLLVTRQARPGKEEELAGFLAGALPYKGAASYCWWIRAPQSAGPGVALPVPLAEARRSPDSPASTARRPCRLNGPDTFRPRGHFSRGHPDRQQRPVMADSGDRRDRSQDRPGQAAPACC